MTGRSRHADTGSPQVDLGRLVDMRTPADGARPDPVLGTPPVSRPLRLLGVLAASALLMGLTGLGLVAVQHAAHSTAVTAAETATASGGHLPDAPDATALPSVKRILASAAPAEGSGAEREHSKADHRHDQRTGELDR